MARAICTQFIKGNIEKRKNSAVYQGRLKVINKALQKNLQSVSVNTKNCFIKCKSQSGKTLEFENVLF